MDTTVVVLRDTIVLVRSAGELSDKWEFGTDALLNLTNVLVTIGVTIYLAWLVNKKLANNRSVKDFCICELKLMLVEQTHIFESIRKEKASSQELLAQLKILSVSTRLIQDKSFENFKLKENYLEKIDGFKHFITGCEDFNSQYNSKTLKFDRLTMNRILEYEAELKGSVYQLCIEIHRANAK